MDLVEGNTEQTWIPERVETIDQLDSRISELRKRAGPKGVAWRGQARRDWQLETTIDRALKKAAPEESYEEWLCREQAILEHFRYLARPYASDTEHAYLGNVWQACALGRHAGLPTRLLDWTRSPFVGVWFVCHEHSNADGALWWYDIDQFEKVLHRRWPDYRVPDRAEVCGLDSLSPEERQRCGLNERVLEWTAFDPNGSPWVSQVFQQYPCQRMEAQQGFTMACGQLQKTHNRAIDELDRDSEISRGRIIIPARMKGEFLSLARAWNLNATSIKYPGVDIAAQKVCSEYFPD